MNTVVLIQPSMKSLPTTTVHKAIKKMPHNEVKLLLCDVKTNLLSFQSKGYAIGNAPELAKAHNSHAR